ncbi:hypothetical protein ACFL09_06540, partial [Planctomycetota bacterium]
MKWGIGRRVALLAVILLSTCATGAELALVLPLARTAYQTNETIDLAVVRSSGAALAAGNLTLVVSGTDGSKMRFTFPVRAVPAIEGSARRTEHLHLNGWLMRPGHYAVEVGCDGAAAQTEIDVYSHIRKSSFRLIDWGRAKGKHQL